MGNTTSQYLSSGAAAHVPAARDTVASLDKVLWKRIEETATLARSVIQDGKPLQDCKSILDSFSHLSEVIHLRDMKGLTLLQHAIIKNRKDLIEYMLQKGADINVPICGRPLHLATKLGNVEIVKLLLEYHADPDVLSCVCYPEKHFDSQMVCVPQMEHMYLACCGDIYSSKSKSKTRFDYPSYYAIVADSVECVKIFAKVQHVSQDSNAIPNLHNACKLGSRNCLKHFIQQEKDSLINQLDSSGKSPIMYALKWDKAFLELLVLNGAMLNVKTKNKQNLLHILLTSNPINMFESLKYLLDCGLKMNVNAVDSTGNSALNVLLLCLEGKKHLLARQLADVLGNEPLSDQSSHLARCSFRARASQTTSSKASPVLSWSAGMEYFTNQELQYIHCVELLLKAGLNPNIANRTGNAALHIISRLQDTSVSESNEWASTHYIDMQFVYTLMLSVIKAKGNVNLANNSEQTILTQFVNCTMVTIFSHVQNVKLLQVIDHQNRYFIACLRLLYKSGAQFQLRVGRNPSQICFMHSTFDVLDEFHRASHLVSSSMRVTHDPIVMNWASKVLAMVRDVTLCFLECGLDPNVCTDATQKHLSLLYYKLLTNKPIVPIKEIEDFLRLLLHYGVGIDENGQPILMTVLRPHSGTGYRQLPCYPLLHLVNLIASRQLRHKEEELFSLMEVLYNAMSEDNARQCIQMYLEYDRFIGSGPKYEELDEYLISLLHRPRKLKQLAAKFVYRKLAGQKLRNVRRLPVPVVLQNYLASFHY